MESKAETQSSKGKWPLKPGQFSIQAFQYHTQIYPGIM